MRGGRPLQRPGLGACRTWGVESENRPRRGQFLPVLPAHRPVMGQKDGEKWTAVVDLQPTIPKSDRLPGAVVVGVGPWRQCQTKREPQAVTITDRLRPKQRRKTVDASYRRRGFCALAMVQSYGEKRVA